MKSRITNILALLSCLLLFVVVTQKASAAYYCAGNGTCCTQQHQECSFNNTLNRQVCGDVCDNQNSGFSCEQGGGGCGMYGCNWVISTNCYLAGSPDVTPALGGGGGGGGCQSGWCTSKANCDA